MIFFFFLSKELHNSYLLTKDKTLCNSFYSFIPWLPGCVNLSFAYVEGESLLMALKDVALSSGRSDTLFQNVEV